MSKGYSSITHLARYLSGYSAVLARSLIPTIGLFALIVLLGGTALAKGSVLSPYQGCWRTVPSNNDTTNYIELCIAKSSLQLAIFYPNDGRKPTTCRASGSVKLTDEVTLVLRTRGGQCENGRSLATAHLNCSLNGTDELYCLHPGFELIRLFRDPEAGQLLDSVDASGKSK